MTGGSALHMTGGVYSLYHLSMAGRTHARAPSPQSSHSHGRSLPASPNLIPAPTSDPRRCTSATAPAIFLCPHCPSRPTYRTQSCRRHTPTPHHPGFALPSKTTTDSRATFLSELSDPDPPYSSASKPFPLISSEHLISGAPSR